MNDKEKQSSGRDEVKNRNFMAIWDKICCTLAALGGCTLNRGSFACKFVQGDMPLAAKGRGTLNRGGRNCRWDCICENKGDVKIAAAQ